MSCRQRNRKSRQQSQKIQRQEILHQRKKKAQDEPQEKPQSIPEAVAGALIARLEELEAEIVAKQKEIAAKEKEYKEIATFMGCKTA